MQETPEPLDFTRTVKTIIHRESGKYICRAWILAEATIRVASGGPFLFWGRVSV
jgi:hypothetical protein